MNSSTQKRCVVRNRAEKMETTDASCEQIISKLEINENTAQIERISTKQLDLIERDLDFNEKVSWFCLHFPNFCLLN